MKIQFDEQSFRFLCIYNNQKVIHGLKQVIILAYDNLVEKLQPYGYKSIPHTMGLWKQYTKPIILCICVYDFGIRYFNNSYVNNLLQYLQISYTATVDWSGKISVVSPFIGNTTMDMLTCQCQVM